MLNSQLTNDNFEPHQKKHVLLFWEKVFFPALCIIVSSPLILQHSNKDDIVLLQLAI